MTRVRTGTHGFESMVWKLTRWLTPPVLPLCTLMLVALTASSPRARAAADDQARRCAQCDGAIVEKLKVVVTDFATRREHLYCNMACAITAMAESFPTSRAVAHDPFARKEVRIIRTGAKWVAWPTSAVFLFLPETNGAKTSDQAPPKPAPQKAADKKGESAPAASPPSKPSLDPAQRCLAFPRQVEYVQYLATHAEVAALKPRPLRLGELLAAVRKQEKKEPPAQ